MSFRLAAKKELKSPPKYFLTGYDSSDDVNDLFTFMTRIVTYFSILPIAGDLIGSRRTG